MRTPSPAALLVAACAALGAGCGGPLNSPYPPGAAESNTLYAPFSERPKHLDPAVSYSENEYVILAQVYEPPLQYHYLRRPYTLVPLTATHMPRVRLLDAGGRTLPPDAPPEAVAVSEYEVHIQPGIRYQPHPAFARDADGALRFHALTSAQLARIETLDDFPATGARELVAADYVHQIKRLAHPRVHSPIFGLMSEHIVGLAELAGRLRERAGRGEALDLAREPFEGAYAVDRHTFRVRVRGVYPQMAYWLAMPFFAPLPPEVEAFYAQPGLAAKNLTLDWYPVGTGPYMLVRNDPNRRMELRRNPNFRGEPYPADGSAEDRAAGLLADAGRPMPFIDRVVFSLEQESIPVWTKFLQGYYDRSAVQPDSFDQAITLGGSGDLTLSPAMRAKGIRLSASVAPAVFYIAVNMLDPVLGGESDRARLLRRALAIAIDQEDAIAIFYNGLGQAMQGPIPPGIFGYRGGAQGINPYVYRWQDGHPARRPLEEARALLAQAGYPGGRDGRTGTPLVLYFDTPGTGPDAKAYLDWLRAQLRQLGIALVVRATDYNRFQDKMLTGRAQLFQWGWNADYPDPENFLFLFYGPNAMAESRGENASNYRSARFDALFERMRAMPDGAARQAIIDQMVETIRSDAPWIAGFHREDYVLSHAWNANLKTNQMANNTLKYQRLDPTLRARLQARWNAPVWWPLGALAGVLTVLVAPAVHAYRRRERAHGRG
jgi:oligopeptide transport system substrate-binding protein